jgi:hypothetical protein
MNTLRELLFILRAFYLLPLPLFIDMVKSKETQ